MGDVLGEDIVGNDPFLEFFAIAFIAPIVAGIIALLTARIGSSGKLRKLELIQKEMDVTTQMLSKSNVDEEFKERLRENMRSLAGDLAYLHGDSRLDEGNVEQQEANTVVPKAWSSATK